MVILASGSPRRRELLSQMGIEFEIITSDVDETPTEKNPVEIVKELSKRKGQDVFSRLFDRSGDKLVISADTLVFLGDKRLGKPSSEENAAEMLKDLSGKEHQVITGVSLIYEVGGEVKKASFAETTSVYVSKLSKEEIDAYVATGEPMDKAGAYAIQGLFAKYIEKIEGEYSNVVGLPVAHLYRALKEIGYVR